MDKSAITMTADDDWWLERITMDGEQRYPERIRVGSLENPRVYVPERTCQIVVSVDRNPASYGGRVHRCSSCGKAFPKQFFSNGWTRLSYCPTCGAHVIGTVSREEA